MCANRHILVMKHLINVTYHNSPPFIQTKLSSIIFRLEGGPGNIYHDITEKGFFLIPNHYHSFCNYHRNSYEGNCR